MKPIWLLMMKCSVPATRWPRRPRQAEDFGDHALAGEGGVAVQQQRQHLGAFLQRHDLLAGAAIDLVLLGARLAHHDGIDDLEMRRVGGQRQMHLVAVELAVRRGAEMVLHVAGTLDVVGGVRSRP